MTEHITVSRELLRQIHQHLKTQWKAENPWSLDDSKVLSEQLRTALEPLYLYKDHPVDQLVDVYCKAWEKSFLTDNPYHTVDMSSESKKHIEAGLIAVIRSFKK